MKKTVLVFGGLLLSLLLLPSSAEAANELSVRCSATPTDRVVPGELVTYTARVEGGRGTYFYDWSGTDNVRGSSRTLETFFRTEGTKRMQVTVRSGSETRTANCPTLYLSHEPLRGWCSARAQASNELISTTWSVGVLGGTGSYDIRWSGSEGLSGAGRQVTKTYTSGGDKSARAHITDASGYELVLNCSVDIPEVYKLEAEPLSFGCTYASRDPRTRYDSAWQAFYTDRLTRTGRSDPDEPTFRWNGSEGLSRHGSYVRLAYEDPGRKRASVTSVSDRGNIRVTSECEAFVIDEELIPPRTRRIARNYTPTVTSQSNTGSSISPRTGLPSSSSNSPSRFNTAYANPGQSVPQAKAPSCFITSATEGSENQEAELEAFRNVRDSRLSGTPAGESLIGWYYDMSKKSAPVLERNPYAQSTAAALLQPFSLILQAAGN